MNLMTTPDSFQPLLPAYLKVTAVNLLQSTPPRFDLRLATFPATLRGISVAVSAEALFLLSLADGSRTFAECLHHVSSEFGAIDQTRSAEFDDLVDRGVLVDAREHPEVLPGTRDRYARHLLFFASVGAHASQVQSRLAASRVALIGVGGVGTWLSFLLGAAGVGTIKLIDGDRIEESNLTRQLYFTPRDIGEPKVEVARRKLIETTPHVKCEAYPRSIVAANDMEELVGDVDLILLSGDHPADINDIVDRYAYSLRRAIPWSAAGYAHAAAVCGPLLVPGRTGCRKCVMTSRDRAPVQDLPLVDEINARFQVPSFGPVNGLAASIQSKEAIAWLGGMDSLVCTMDAVCVMDALTLQTIVEPMHHALDCDRCSSAAEGVRHHDS